MKQITILLFKDRGSPVGRYQIPVALIERWKKVAILVGVLFAIGLVDYGRARMRTWEIDKLRKEASANRKYVEDLQSSMDALNGELERLHELERKMRIIANVPGAPVGASSARGIGGDEDQEEFAPEEGVPDADQTPVPRRPKAPDTSLRKLDSSAIEPMSIPGAAGIHGDGVPAGAKSLAEDRGASLSPGRLLALQEESLRLRTMAESRSAALADLVEHLYEQSDRLASTPSIWPTRGWLTSSFGNRMSPLTGQRQFHGALDIAGQVGTEIIASARGRVVFSGVKPQLGNCLILEHGNGIQTIYAHNSKLLVKVGAQVERGAPIAKMGSTGRSTGPHLHYAISVNGKLVDPLDYILD